MPDADPGYGDPRAPIGSPEWAKRWRLGFQAIVKSLPESPASSLRYLKLGEQHRAWTLLTDRAGKPYPDFDSFCRDAQPWGLGMEPVKFRAYLEAEIGKRAAELVTVNPDGRSGNGANQHTGPKEDSHHDDGNPSSAKQERLRAILRAPEAIQDLYREGLISQTVAAAMGPATPDEETAALVVRARDAATAAAADPEASGKVERRRRVDAAVRETLGRTGPSPLDLLRRAWAKASEDERRAFRAIIDAETQ